MASWDTPVVSAPKTSDYAAPLVNFDAIAKAPETYYKGQQMARDEQKATIFRNGIPKDANGNIDVPTVTEQMAKIGGYEYAAPLINMQIQGQQARAAQGAMDRADAAASGGVPPQSATVVQPASPQLRAATPAASVPQVQSGAPQSAPPSGPQQTTVMSVLAAQGIPNNALQAASESVARQLGVGTNDPINTQDPQVRNVLGPAIAWLKKNRVGEVVQEGAAPQAADSQPSAPAASAQPAVSSPPVNPNVQQLQKQADRYGIAAGVVARQALEASATGNKQLEESLRARAAYFQDLQKGVLDQIAKANEDAPDIKLWRQSGSKLPYDQWVAASEGNKEKARQDAQVAPSIREWQQSGSKLPYDDWVAATEADKAEARETAKAGHRFREVQPVPGGPTYLVPESKLAEGATDGSQPGMVAKQPGFIADRQKEIAKDEQAMLEQYRSRQIARERLQTLADLMQNYETGSFAQRKADMVAALRGVGIPVKDTDTANPAAFQTFLKNATANVFDNAKSLGGRILVSEINGLTKANANPEMQPEANRAILGQAIGLLDHADKHFNDYFTWKRQNPNAYDTTGFETQWTKDNPVKDFTTKAEHSIAAKGVPVPADPARRVVNQKYMTPKGPATWMGNGWKLDGTSAAK